MLDKLKAISPVLIVALLLCQGYLIWAVHDARDQARSASFMAMQASNAANNSATTARNTNATGREVRNQMLSLPSSCARACGGSSRVRGQIHATQTYASIYHEFLLEDLALRAKLDLKSIRRDFQGLARKMGHHKPRGWRWARPAK